MAREGKKGNEIWLEATALETCLGPGQAQGESVSKTNSGDSGRKRPAWAPLWGWEQLQLLEKGSTGVRESLREEGHHGPVG